ncbi:type II toxin-antitoxin system VapC family toxin [Aurantimonas sp. MSK8Z-1]|uniref:type II toxin-antitoxin system VapC family toxin n=1 Tax=Mangrovibrevibacter kandeliae TaxID=2968473 RepID=UPI0021194B75|nr:type II toxin-antitoxin system VapC family toxin [Aurantimonas sp. MSK8Z-1]MCW4115548.1 type II toxin-antitoxin system VapC family toxin [Aurantimonas sp. MSK8Z-1]
MLLDTHAFYWLVSGDRALSDEALIAIAISQSHGALFVSPISAWELAIAAQKPQHREPPQLKTTISKWFRTAVRETAAKVAPINQTVAFAAAEVPVLTGHKDPGDCYLLATARVRKVAIVTRDSLMLGLAKRGFVDVVNC